MPLGQHENFVTPLDEARLQALFESERHGLFRSLLRLTGNASDADDLLQETFLAVWRKRKEPETGRHAGYLRRTAYHLFVNHHKARKRREGLHRAGARPEAGESADREVERADSQDFLHQQIREAVDRLPEAVRHAFVLHRFEGWTAREIAEATGVPLKTTETRIRRGVALLAESLRPLRRHLPVRP